MSRVLEPLAVPVFGSLAAALSLLHRACFPQDPWDAATIRRIAAIPGFFGRIACEAAQPIAFVFALDLGGECEVLSLGVVPGHRRTGAAAALLGAVAAEARRRGAGSLVLEVAEDNAAARALYAAHGFVRVGERPNYYRRAQGAMNAVVLRRTLDPASLST